VSGTDVSLTDLLLQTMRATVDEQEGPMLGSVNTYDPATRRMNVTPLVPLYVEPGDEPVPSPPIPHVLTIWPETATHSIKWPLAKNSTVILEPLGHDHTAWMVTGKAGEPAKSSRRFSLADIVAIPLGALPNTSPAPATSYDPTWAVLYGMWAAGGSDATEFVALATKVLTELQSIKTAFDAHTHAYLPGPGPSTPTATPLNPMPAPGSVAATMLKAK